MQPVEANPSETQSPIRATLPSESPDLSSPTGQSSQQQWQQRILTLESQRTMNQPNQPSTVTRHDIEETFDLHSSQTTDPFLDEQDFGPQSSTEWLRSLPQRPPRSPVSSLRSAPDLFQNAIAPSPSTPVHEPSQSFPPTPLPNNFPFTFESHPTPYHQSQWDVSNPFFSTPSMHVDVSVRPANNTSSSSSYNARYPPTIPNLPYSTPISTPIPDEEGTEGHDPRKYPVVTPSRGTNIPTKDQLVFLPLSKRVTSLSR